MDNSLKNKEKIWIPIPGFEGKYAVSDDGELMSMDYRRTGLPGLLKPQINRLGYMRVMLIPKKMTSVHSLVMLAFVGPRPYRMDINHKNGIKHDNRLENLEYVTTAQNMQHAAKSGRWNHAKGAKHYRSKLDEEKVKEIRRLVSMRFTYKEIGQMMGVSTGTICHVALGQTWTHVKDETTT